jgi:hypothetical protein
MSNLLKQINETWELHYLDDLPRGVGCLAFAVDERCVHHGGIDYRLAVSFGDNIWPDDRPQGVLTPHPMPGRLCFGIHCVGTRGGRMALFDMWMSGREAAGCQDARQGEAMAKALLAAIPDEQYLTLAEPGLTAHPPRLRTAQLLPLDEYVLVHDVEL